MLTPRTQLPWNETRVTSALKIRYPIIQGPLGGFSSQRLTAAVSNFGGLGSFGGHGLRPETIAETIAEIRSLTDRPFAMNLWVSMQDDGAFTSDRQAFERGLRHIAPHLKALGQNPPVYQPYEGIRFEDQARILLDARVPVFSFIYGIPPRELLDECRRLGIVIMGTATTVEEAKALEDAGVDIVVASGFEAGGHRGSFLRSSEESLTGTFSLTPQVADAIALPVVAAGGISDARGVLAAFALGAEGVQMGSAFLACEESGASKLHRRMLLDSAGRSTGLTRGFTGRLARGFRNTMMDDWNSSPEDILPYPLQRRLVRHLSVPAQSAEQEELLPLWAGQSAGLNRHTQAQLLMEEITSALSEIGGPVLDWAEGRALKERS
ncbi:NAD(P)H-dependent flavin oxidoreductase [Acidicapsa ligni]|uniref:NAD(P)H-dependent flavin oxidoreductase n=1 Tax=Acidicapsa ligni TaxID=542300 RepID=UPI0021E064CA|nr:nitronate monooxygenase [Acidicapsa ligni]